MIAFRFISLALGASAMLGFSASAFAADIGDRYEPRAAQPYDDPRYGDVYRHPPPPRYAEPRYEEPRYQSPPRESWEPREPRNRHGYLAPMNPPYASYHDDRYDPRCVPRAEIKRGLVNDGWRDFHELEFQGHLALINARRPNGQLYALKIDRCSGEIVRARPLEERPYAYRDRYNERPYY